MSQGEITISRFPRYANRDTFVSQRSVNNKLPHICWYNREELIFIRDLCRKHKGCLLELIYRRSNKGGCATLYFPRISILKQVCLLYWYTRCRNDFHLGSYRTKSDDVFCSCLNLSRASSN